MQEVNTKSDAIAIIGMSCRLPGGSQSPAEFFEFLLQGGDGIVEVPADRWSNQAYYDQDKGKKNRLYINQGGFIQNIDQFEPQFFGISPKEAPAIDPQHRWLLELTHEVLENAGLKPSSLRGSDTAVYIGQFMHDYEQLQMDAMAHDLIDSHSATGQSMTLTANRISYLFDFKGPSVALDTACSSSLVALDMACQAILRGDSNLAIAGGVNILLKPEATMAICKASMLSPDCRCKSFDASANGYVRSEGAAIVLIKRLEDTVRDKDPILAVIRATGVNQDGQTNGITVPNGDSQQKLLQKSLQRAGLNAADIQYLEAHGTGTAVGDPIEINAMGSVLKTRSLEEPACIFGSVKSNIGHTEAVAGVAGLIKTVLSLNAGKIPRNINFNKINPAIDLQSLNLQLAQENTSWPVSRNKPRLALVNSFGFGGTNANVIVQEGDIQNPLRKKLLKVKTEKSTLANYWLPLSAKNENSLNLLVNRYVAFLKDDSDYLSLEDICFTAAEARDHFSHRVIFSGANRQQLMETMEAWLQKQVDLGWVSGLAQSHFDNQPVFVFSGMGTQWVSMGKDLYETHALFKKVIDKCDAALSPFTGWSLVEKLYTHPETDLNNRTDISQPAIFAVQLALFELLASWGIAPQAIVGHSAGEVAAAHLAGVYTFDDAIKIIFERSRLQYTTEGTGKMLAVGLSENDLQAYIQQYKDVSIAAINDEDAITLAGDEKSLQSIAENLDNNGHFAKFLNVNVPYHSPVMDLIKQPLIDCLSSIQVNPPKVKLYSTVTGQLTTTGDWGPTYWADNVRNPVLFKKAIENLLADGATSFIEVSAHPALSSAIEKIARRKKVHASIASCLKRDANCALQIRRLIGQLYVNGVDISWKKLYPQGEKVLLPNYQWTRASYWLEDEGAKSVRINNLVAGAGTTKEDHIFLGRPVSSHLGLWQKNISLDEVSLLADHKVEGEVVYPAAAYIDTALALASIRQPAATVHLENIAFHKALFLNNDKVTQLETHIDFETGRYEIGRVNSADENWACFNNGRIVRETNKSLTSEIKRLDINNLSKKFADYSVAEEFYQHCFSIGLHYLPKFQAIKNIWFDNEEAFAEFSLPMELRNSYHEYKLHPVILDAAFQNLFATINYGALPVSIGRLSYYQQPQYEGYSHLITRFKNQEVIIGDIVITDKEGNLLVEISNILCKPTNTNLSSIDKFLYELIWEEKNRNPESEATPLASVGKWILFKENPDNLGNFPELLGSRADYQIINPAALEVEELTSLLNEQAQQVSGVIYFSPDNSDQALDEQILESSSRLLKITQAIVAVEWKSSFAFYLVTKGAQSVGESQNPVNLQDAAHLGFFRVLASEHNDIFVAAIDLDYSQSDYQVILEEILSNNRDREVAYRNGVRYVHRLDYLNSKSLANHANRFVNLGEHDAYTYSEDKKVLQKYPLQESISSGQIKVSVKSAVPGNSRWGITGVYICAGEVTSSHAVDIKPGNKVIFASDLLASEIVIEARSAAIIPAHLSFEHACVSAMESLARYAILDLIGGKENISNLLLMGSGSVLGESILELAEENNWHIRIPSTDAYKFSLSTEQNWSLGIASHPQIDLTICTSDFDIGEIPHLKPFSFVIDWRNQLLDAQTLRTLAENNIQYHSINLSKLLAHQPHKIATWLGKVMAEVHGPSIAQYQKISLKNWVTLEDKEALHWVDLQQDLPQFAIPPTPVYKIKQQSTYLITGGLSGLGLVMMEWLVQKGAGNIVLTARRSPDASLEQKIEAIRAKGINLLILQADIADYKQAENLFERIQSEMPPLAGVLHSAGVLDDAMISQQSAEKFAKVFAPKVSGAYNLHLLTQSLSLDWFVCFSSVAAVLGWAGQVNYAAANSFMDALCIYRRQQGLPGLSINWGPWAEAGMAARLDTQDKERMENSGMYPLLPKAGTAALDKILQYPLSQVGVFDIDWPKFIKNTSGNLSGGLLEKFSESMDLLQSESLKEKLMNLPENEREYLLQETILHLLAGVIGLSGSDQINPKTNLFEYGLNSLMAMDFKSRLQNELAIPLPATLVLKYPTVEAMADHILMLMNKSNLAVDNKKVEEVYVGPVNLTPQQIKVLTSGLMPERFVIPYHRLIKNLDPKILESALVSVINYHDALRLSFSLVNNQWSARVNPQIDSFSVVEIMPENFDAQNIESWLDEYMFKLMLEFDITSGPLIKAFRFSSQDKSESLVSILIHHLTNDIISTNQIIDDLLKIYTDRVKGKSYSLPTKPVSYKNLVHRIYDYAKSPAILKEKDYWLSLPWSSVRPLPLDYLQGDNNYGSTYRVALSLTEVETEKLNRILAMQLKVPLHHALISAMSFALASYQNSNNVYFSSVDGRHILNQVAGDLDSSRVAGWFSTESHLLLETNRTCNAIERLLTIKKQMESIPNSGIGLQLLSLVVKDPDIQKDVMPYMHGDLMFNYIGNIENSLIAERLNQREILGEKCEHDERNLSQREVKLLFLFVTLNGKLGLDLQYSKNLHKHESMIAIARNTMQELLRIIADSQPGQTALLDLHEKADEVN